MALENAVEPRSHFVDQFRRRQRPRPARLPKNPAGQQVEPRVGGGEGAVGDLAALDHALHPPGGIRVELDLGLALRLAVLPRLSAAEVGRVVLGHAKIALPAGCEPDVADDARDAERPLVLLVQVPPDQVPGARLGQERVRVHGALARAVARDRPVRELDRPLLGDGTFELRQTPRHLVGVVGVAHLDPETALGRGLELRRPAERKVLEGKPQRLRVGELAVEQVERDLQRGQLLVVEVELGEEVLLCPERVELLAGELVPLGVQGHAEGDELAPVRVEAACKGLVRHLGVALDDRLDLARGQRAPLRHQEGNERELPDQLVGVVRHDSYSVNPVTIVAHLDLDAFFAAVEELENSTLAAQPLVVGGDPRGRGVVATANYVARTYGIHSAMSCAEALRRCPHAVFVTPRHRTYAEYSRAVWAAVREVVPTVERTGMDEGYLDVGGVAADFRRARVVAEAVQAAVRGATSLSCSLGVAGCKVVAKVASDRRKPGGITVVPSGREAAFLAPFPVRLLPGVGPKAEQRLAGRGIRLIGELAAIPEAELAALLPGKIGRLLRDRANGIDPRPLVEPVANVSFGHEETFPRDIADREQLHVELRRMALRIAVYLAELRPGRAHRDDEASLSGLLDPQPLDDAPRRPRRR